MVLNVAHLVAMRVMSVVLGLTRHASNPRMIEELAIVSIVRGKVLIFSGH